MDISGLRALSSEDLQAELAKAGERLFRVRFLKSMGNQDGAKELRPLRREVARMHTVLKERSLTQPVREEAR